MKTKQLLLLVVTIIATVSFSFSQKLKKEKLAVYKYVQPPTDPLPENYKAYLLKIDANDPYIADEIFKNFNLIGYEKKRSGDYQFTIEIKDYPFRYSTQKKVVEEKVTKDDKTTTVKYYVYNYNIKYQLTSRMLDTNGEEIFSTTANINKSGNTSAHGNPSDAYKEVMNIINKYEKDRVYLATKELNNIYNDKFGYPVKYKKLNIYKIKSKKFNYDDFDKAYEIAVKAAEIIKNDMNATEQCMQAITPAIEIWEKALQESDLTKKKTRINKNVTCAAYYNIANAYALCGDYDKALEYLNKIKEIDKRFSNIYALSIFVEDMKKRTDAAKK